MTGALPLLSGLGDVDAVSSMDFGNATWLVVFHQSQFKPLTCVNFKTFAVRDKKLISLVDTDTVQVVATQVNPHTTSAFEILDRNITGRMFTAIHFGERTHRLATVTPNAVLLNDCAIDNERLLGRSLEINRMLVISSQLGCPTPLCSPSFKVDAITRMQELYYAFSHPFVHVVDGNTKQLVNVSLASTSFAPLSDHIRPNATYAIQERLFVVAGPDLLSFEVSNYHALTYQMHPLRAVFDEWPKNSAIDAALYNSKEDSLTFFVNDVYWKYSSRASADRNFEGIGIIDDFSAKVPSKIDASFFEDDIVHFVKWPGLVQVRQFKNKTTRANIVSLMRFFNCDIDEKNIEARPCTSAKLVLTFEYMNGRAVWPSGTNEDIDRVFSNKLPTSPDIAYTKMLDQNSRQLQDVMLKRSIDLKLFLDRMPIGFDYNILAKGIPGLPENLPDEFVERLLRKLASVALKPSFQDVWQKLDVGKVAENKKLESSIEQTAIKRAPTPRR